MSKNEYISVLQHEKNPRTLLRENDVILSTVGTIGNCAVVDKSILPANCDRHVGIIRIEKIFKPYYLSTFLLSKYGKFQSFRESTGNVQLNLFIYKIREIKVPNLNHNFQELIENIVIHSKNISENSKQLYQEAEELLLTELGLKDWQPTEDNITVKSFSSSFINSGRLDAEYYQPKYDQIESKIKLNKYSIIGNEILKIDTGEYSPEYYSKNESEDLVFYIRSTNIKNGQIELDDSYYVPKSQFTKIAKKGDIVTARVGSVGIFAEIRDELDGSVYSDNILCFRLPNLFISSVYTLLFNSQYYFELIDRLARGSVQQRLNQETLKDLIIPIIDFSKQQKIAELLEESFRLRVRSKQLLEIAKKGVEKAIESEEETAIKWINEELEKMGIEV